MTKPYVREPHDSPTGVMSEPHDAGLLVESLQNLIPVWAHIPKNDHGLRDIVYGEPLLPKWWEGELTTVLARAGDSPMHLPSLGAFLNPADGVAESTRDLSGSEYHSDFIPYQALANLVWWDATFWDEDERLLEMETRLRSATGLWRREDLFLQWQLSHSASPEAIARREEDRNGLVRAQWEFAEALEQRDPAIAAVYRRCRDVYHEAKEAFAWIDRTKAIQREGDSYRYSPERVWGSYDDARHYHLYISYHFFERPPLHWWILHEEWTDPALKDWDHVSHDSWEHQFAKKLVRTERPTTDSSDSQ